MNCQYCRESLAEEGSFCHHCGRAKGSRKMGWGRLFGGVLWALFCCLVAFFGACNTMMANGGMFGSSSVAVGLTCYGAAVLGMLALASALGK